MQYYVIGPDGSKYGPGDVPTLKQWAADNRLTPDTILEDIQTGQRLAAYQVQGIFENPQQTATAPVQPGSMAPPSSSEQNLYQNAPNMAPPPGYYPRQQTGDGGKTLIVISWVCSSIGFLCCPVVLCLAGVICAIVAMTQGSKKWVAPMIFGICTMVVGVIISVMTQNWLQEWLRQLQQQQPR